MATRTVEHEVNLATVIEMEIFTLTPPTYYFIGINRIIAMLESLNINYNAEELGSALNELLHEKKIKLDIGSASLNDLMASEKKESPKISLYFKKVAT